MKSAILAAAAWVGILGQGLAWAGSDDYPAANFQPKVIFLDESLKASATSSSSSTSPQYDSRYPAAYFQPKIIVAAAPSATSSAPEIAYDPKYPAAYFQPKVIYP